LNIKRMLSKAQDVKITDYFSAFPMTAGLILAPFFKKKYSNTWGIGERKTEARDNGYHFYKYMLKKHPEQKCIYVIDKKSRDYRKVKNHGEIVQPGTIKHWILYFTCQYLISSQSFKPNGYICTFFERAGLFRPHHVFLQHGITINKPEYLRADLRKAEYFMTVTPQETDFVAQELGYGSQRVFMTGFPRFDALHNHRAAANRVFIMPTWRKWLKLKSEEHSDAGGDILSSEYIKYWKELLTSEKLQSIADELNLEIVFYPHPNFKGVIDTKALVGRNVRVADIENEDIQKLMLDSKVLITDYSSVFFDMVYMKRPVIFFQFDEEKFRKYHYEQGWFDYHKTAFGKIFVDPEDVVDELKEIADADFRVSEALMDEHEKTFPLYDNRNSERVYRVLRGEYSQRH